MTDFSRPEEPRPEADSSAPQPERKRGLPAGLLSLPRFLASRFGLTALGLAAVGGLLYAASQGDGFIKRNELEREKAKLEAEIDALQDENRLLRERLDRLNSDPALVEDEARKKLGLIRPGETVYRLSEEPDLTDDFQDPALP